MTRAILLSRENDAFKAEIRDVTDTELEAATPGDDVDIEVEYSTINYKDGLAITNTSPVVRKWPMVAGIDAAGRVKTSAHPKWKTGDSVVLNGWGLGESHWGGLAQRARAKGDWLVRIPAPLTTRDAMAIGTAGYTAALSVLALQNHGIAPPSGEILVTGATGGVGSIAVALLASLGYAVVGSTGKATEADYLKALGAKEVIDRATLAAPGKPLQKDRWAGAIDSVGSTTLANVCAQTRWGGTVAACGLAGGMDFPASVAPFILRGVTLAGIDSVMAPLPRREAAWKLLAEHLRPELLARMTREVTLAGAFDVARDILAGHIRGRVVVDVNR
ncbi:MAG TPA: MDR family oxidoreductase [Burkholderiaceae bacterium]|nr:MDR family oxidoreductase [Burkholderiaceae bacterium]